MSELNAPVDPQETYRSILQHQLSILLRDPGAVFLVERQLQQAADQYAADAAGDSRKNARVVERPRESGPAPSSAPAGRASFGWLEEAVRAKLREEIASNQPIGEVRFEQVPGFDQFTLTWFAAGDGGKLSAVTVSGPDAAGLHFWPKRDAEAYIALQATNLILLRDAGK